MTSPVSLSHSGEAWEICVVGSSNMDLVVRVPRHPVPGETVLGGDLTQIPGGKGANQAIAAARLGRKVKLIGRVGDDSAGEELLGALASAGVDLANVQIEQNRPSGFAMISVGPTGENSIVVSPGANSWLTEADIAGSSPALSQATVTLVQLEVPLVSVLAAARLSTGLVLLNPAPAHRLPKELLDEVDVLIPNQTELAVLAGTQVATSHDEVLAQVRLLGIERLVVTLGAQGAMVVDNGLVEHLPAPAVEPVDTTAAGDAFCAALADELVAGSTLGEAAEWAVRVGAATTLREGAQPSLPTRSEVASRLKASATART